MKRTVLWVDDDKTARETVLIDSTLPDESGVELLRVVRTGFSI